MEIFIRTAQVDEADNLTRIAFSAKRHWQYPEAWIELWSDELTITGDYIQANDVYCASIGNAAVGWYALIRSGDVIALDYFWVLPEKIGREVGTAMMRHAKGLFSNSQAEAMIVISDPNAEGFYLKMGYEKVGMHPSIPEGRFIPILTFTKEIL